MNETSLLVGVAPAIVIILSAAYFTWLLSRSQSVLAFMIARLGEPSTKGALIFASGTLYQVLVGTLDWRPALYFLMQSAFHALQPDVYTMPTVTGLIPGEYQTFTGISQASAAETALLAEADAHVKEGRAFDISNVTKALANTTAVILLVGMCLSLSACGSALPDLAKTTLDDMKNAKAMADVTGDTDASQCYGAQLPVAQTLNDQIAAADTSIKVGVFSAFQAGRTAKLSMSGTGLIGRACAPLWQQTKGDASWLGALLGFP